jgi:hypothetical protein
VTSCLLVPPTYQRGSCKFSFRRLQEEATEIRTNLGLGPRTVPTDRSPFQDVVYTTVPYGAELGLDRNIGTRLKEAQELAHVGSWEWVVADDGEWSEELYRICGVDPESFVPTYQAFMAMLPADERAAVNAVVQKALVDHRPFQVDHHIVRPDGTVRLLTSHGRVVVDARRLGH